MKALRRALAVAVWTLAVIGNAVMIASEAESYRGLVSWSLEHQVPGVWAYAWPLMVDAFPIGGELVLFIALVMKWEIGSRLFAWTLVLVGLAVSIAANVGHVGASADLQTRFTAAVPPVAAWAIMAASLGVLKRFMAGLPDAQELPDEGLWDYIVNPPVRAPFVEVTPDLAAATYAADLAAGRVPGLNRIRRELCVGEKKAGSLQDHLKMLVQTP